MKRVLLLLADGFEPMEAAGFTDVLGWANIDGSEKIEVVSAGLHKQVRATFGYTAQPDYLLEDLDLDSFDAIAIPGGMDREGLHGGFYQDAYAEPFQAAIKHFAHRQQTVASVCVASLALGKAGIIAGRAATVYHQLGGKRKAELEAFGATFVDRPVVNDSGIITSTGPGTAAEVGFALLEALTDADNVAHIRRLMRMPAPAAEWFDTPQVAA